MRKTVRSLTQLWKRKASKQSVVTYDENIFDPERKRCVKMFDHTLEVGGSLSCRLDTSKQHFPEDAKGRARCSLHKWYGIETQSHVSFCATCNVNLCRDCFKYFHTSTDILKEKKKVGAKYKKVYDNSHSQRMKNKSKTNKKK